jgi:hypothetical protein
MRFAMAPLEMPWSFVAFSICQARTPILPSCSRRWRLLAEAVPYLVGRVGNGVACGVGAVAEAAAYVVEAAAKMALAKIIAGGIEVPLRTGAIGVAGR